MFVKDIHKYLVPVQKKLNVTHFLRCNKLMDFQLAEPSYFKIHLNAILNYKFFAFRTA